MPPVAAPLYVAPLETIESVPELASGYSSESATPARWLSVDKTRFPRRRPWLDRKPSRKRRFRGAEFDQISEAPADLIIAARSGMLTLTLYSGAN